MSGIVLGTPSVAVAGFVGTTIPVTQTLDGAADTIATLWIAEASEIASIMYWVGAVTGTAPTYDFRIEDVASDGPDGNLAAAGANGTQQPSAGWNTVNLGTPYTPSDGESLAVVIIHSSGTIDGSNNVTVGYRYSTIVKQRPSLARDLSVGSWTREALLPAFGPLLTSGVIPVGLGLKAGREQPQFDAASSPDEHGVGFVAPATGTINGVMIDARFLGAATTGDVRFYEGTTQKDSVAVDATFVNGTGTEALIIVPISDIAVTKGTTYRATLKGTHATATILMTIAEYPSAAALASAMGYSCFLTTRTNAGAFSDTATKAPGIFPIYKEMTAGGGGGKNAIIGG